MTDDETLTIRSEAAAAAPETGALPSALDGAELPVAFELARTATPLAVARRLRPGYVFRLDRPIGAEVDILVANRRFGRGRLVEIDGEMGVELVEIG